MPDQVFASPVLPGAGIVLLGELGKFAAVSTYGVGGVAVGAGGGLTVQLLYDCVGSGNNRTTGGM